ncbi:MAG: hypothetical protein WCQ95_11295 [Bacteroidota bacterium]
MQIFVRSQIKQSIKNNLPDSQLILIKLTKTDILTAKNGYRKNNNTEFRLGGNLYDIVRQKTHADTTYYYCINDRKEEQLFAKLDSHIKRTTDQNTPQKQKTTNLLKNIIKQALFNNKSAEPFTQFICEYTNANSMLPPSIYKHIPSPPPKNRT